MRLRSRLDRGRGHHRRPDDLGTAGGQVGVDGQLVERLLEQRPLLHQRAPLGARATPAPLPGSAAAAAATWASRSSICFWRFADLVLDLLAGGQQAVDRLLALQVDVGDGVGVGHVGRPLRDRCSRRSPSRRRSAPGARRRPPGPTRAAPDLGLDQLALEHLDLGGQCTIGVDCAGRGRIERRFRGARPAGAAWPSPGTRAPGGRRGASEIPTHEQTTVR